MLVPWLRIIDAALGLKAAARSASDRTADESRRIEQIELERRLAERALRIELLRQAGDREIGRLRLMAAVAVGSWFGTLLLTSRLISGPVAARAMLGSGWLLLLAALSLSFTAQSRVGRALAFLDEPGARHDDLGAGAAGVLVPWLIVLGLGVIGLAVLVS